MIQFKTYRSVVLSFPETTEDPHGAIKSFRVKKKIFATYNPKFHRGCVRLSAIDQDVFTKASKGIIYPVPNKWGKFGWTLVDLKKIKKEMLTDLLTTAYCEVAPEKLKAQVIATLMGPDFD